LADKFWLEFLCIDIPRIIRQVKKEVQCWKSIREKEDKKEFNSIFGVEGKY